MGAVEMCDADAIWHNGIRRCDSFNLRYREDLEPEKLVCTTAPFTFHGYKNG